MQSGSSVLGQQPGRSQDCQGDAARYSLVGPSPPWRFRCTDGREPRLQFLLASVHPVALVRFSRSGWRGQGPRSAPPKSTQVVLRLLPAATLAVRGGDGLNCYRCGWAFFCSGFPGSQVGFLGLSAVSYHLTWTGCFSSYFLSWHLKRNVFPLCPYVGSILQREYTFLGLA